MARNSGLKTIRQRRTCSTLAPGLPCLKIGENIGDRIVPVQFSVSRIIPVQFSARNIAENCTGTILGAEIFTGKNLDAENVTGIILGAEIGDLSGAGALIFVHISNSNKTCNIVSICL